jgi:iron complex outermembrane receptor protein
MQSRVFLVSLLVTTSLVAITASAQAQGSGAQEAAPPVESVVVTGSNIRGADLSPVVNVQAVTADQFLSTGASQISDILTEIPSNTGTALYNETGQLTGTAQFELRGLGFSSTLTLLNGRRAGVAPLSDKSGADFVDINQFPLSMIQRVDVLKDGSSAIYGSEAVAGVVNLITRKGFEGLEISSEFSSSTNQAYSINLASGVHVGTGTINFYATYYSQTGNVRTDFNWLINRLDAGNVLGRSQLLSSNGYPGTYSLAGTGAAGKLVVAPGATSVPDPGCQAAGGVFSVSAAGVTNSTTCDFNFADQIGVIPSEHRLQTFEESEFKLFPHLSYFNEASASFNNNYIFKQPGGFSNGSVSGGDVYVPASSPFNYFIQDPANPNNIVWVNPANWNPAVDHAVAVAGNLRPQGQYFSGQKRQSDTYLRVLNGLDWSLPHEWHATVSHEFAYAEFDENDPVRFNAPILNADLLNGTYNPFATSVLSPTTISTKDGMTPFGNTQSVINQIFYTSNTIRRTQQQVVDLSASGPTFDPGTGMILVAVGGQYRSQTLRYRPDSLSADGLADSPATDAPFSGAEHVYAGYFEAIVPLTELAEVQLAVRHEDYGTGIGASTDPKMTARVDVLPDLLALRGSWGTSFQAPTLTQNATSQAFSIINDPVVLTNGTYSCSPNVLGNNVNVVTSGGGLKPQRSHNYNLGADITPFDNFKVSVDYWNYDYTNLIAAGQNGQSIVNGECGTGTFVNDPRAVRGASGQLFQVNTNYVNVGKVITDGFDLSATYSNSLGDYGDFSFRSDGTFINSFDIYNSNGTVTHAVGSRNFNNNFAPMPAWRGSAHFVWSKDVSEISLGVNYIGAYRNDQSSNGPVDDFATVDLQYAIHLDNLVGDNPSTISIGANNLFNEAPPALQRNNPNGTLVMGTNADIDRPGYDALSGASIQGRIAYIRLKQAF